MSNAKQARESRSDAGAVDRVVTQIHHMLSSMEILPGQPVRQEALAERLGVSRAPVREALGILLSEGILHHERNVGYTVKRLTSSELEQTYLMRRVLETEVIRALPQPSDELLDELASLNEQMQEAGERGDVLELRRLNIRFHFAIFEASGYDLVIRELHRIWSMTDAYRSFYLYEPSARTRVVDEHAQLIEALRHHDLDRAVELMDTHRAEVPAQLAAIISADTVGRS